MTPTDATNENQSILGYDLRERIGEGGYGEVWTAEAPGGLLKAIKFIYGFHDESRAQRELKSLNHIKELRHPFLLSLERIEVVDGRLVIVTELADNSLCDRFDECVREGLIGIPRTELMKYMREAADALDYISKSHSLQHLDIKPENILLVSGHVKVADFGLVKDIHDCTQSVMGGLTPAFAAPELFDGRPSATSDQYSLAIVFQEMLTGVRPFTGSTPAQLAAQHIHGRPNLRPLPRADQVAVARALSKEPDHRFASSLDFINELAQGDLAPVRATVQPRRMTPAANARDSGERTMVLGNLPTSRSSENMIRLPALNFDVEATHVHPTMFIGVGGLGTNVIRETKERFCREFGSSDATPAFRFIAIDVDADDLFAASRGEGNRALSEAEAIHIPLRRPEQYRSVDAAKLSWLSRRWIYNIPRSRKTEGIRPLGRLAAVDNCEHLQEKIAASVRGMLDESALAVTSARVGFPSNCVPRIFLVGGISGGTASGTIVDLAYTIRTILSEHHCKEININGILLHSMGATTSQRGINASNSYACLREMVHFRRNGYPGDEVSRIPAYDATVAPFDCTYFIHLGDDCREEATIAETRRIAEYIYLDTATVCLAANQASRSADAEGIDKIRTLGLADVDISLDSSASKIQAAIADRLIKVWTSSEDKAFDAKTAVRKVMAHAQLNAKNLIDRAVSQISELTGLHPYDFGGTVVDQICRTNAVSAKNAQQTLEETKSSVSDWFRAGGGPTGQRSVVDRATRALAKYATGTSSKLKELAIALLDLPGGRFARAIAIIEEFSQVIEELRATLEQPKRKTSEQIADIESAFGVDAEPSETPIYDHLQRYAGLMVQQELTLLALGYVDSLQADVTEFHERVDAARKSMDQLASTNVIPRSSPDDVDDVAFMFENVLVGEILSKAARLVGNVDQFLQDDFIPRMGTFWKIAETDDPRNLANLKQAIFDVTAHAVRNELSECDVDEIVRSAKLDDVELVDWMRPFVECATPYILDCGGEARVMMTVPRMSTGEACARAVEEVFAETPTVVPATRGDIQVYFEVQKIPVANVALRLIEDVPEAAACVARLGSRNDIEWEPLTGIA